MVRGQWESLARVTLLLFSKDLGLTSHPKDGAFSSIVSPSLYWGIKTHTDYRVSTRCWSH